MLPVAASSQRGSVGQRVTHGPTPTPISRSTWPSKGRRRVPSIMFTCHREAQGWVGQAYACLSATPAGCPCVTTHAPFHSPSSEPGGPSVPASLPAHSRPTLPASRGPCRPGFPVSPRRLLLGFPVASRFQMQLSTREPHLAWYLSPRSSPACLHQLLHVLGQPCASPSIPWAGLVHPFITPGPHSRCH